MRWLVSRVITSIFVAVLLVGLYDVVALWLGIGIHGIVQLALSVGTFSAITAVSGMHWLTERVRQLRQSNKLAISRLERE